MPVAAQAECQWSPLWSFNHEAWPPPPCCRGNWSGLSVNVARAPWHATSASRASRCVLLGRRRRLVLWAPGPVLVDEWPRGARSEPVRLEDERRRQREEEHHRAEEPPDEEVVALPLRDHAGDDADEGAREDELEDQDTVELVGHRSALLGAG